MLDASHTAAQAARREHCFQRLRPLSRAAYDAQGRALDPAQHDRRSLVWHALALLTGDADDRAQAGVLLRSAATDGGHFWLAGITSVLARFGDRLDPDLREDLATRLAAQLPHEYPQRYRGYNDNFPSMAALACVVGGQVVEDPRAVAAGRENLRSLRRLLTRRGVLSEHGSPTYTPITMVCLAEIAELAADAECRELARDGERRCWAELCARWHPATSFVCGPHSRAYLDGLMAHYQRLHAMFWLAFGEAVFVNPLSAAFPLRDDHCLHGGTPTAIHGHIGWSLTATYHPDPDMAALALDKPERCTFRATAEQAPFPRAFPRPERHAETPTMELPASSLAITSHLRPAFALGSSDRTFLDGNQHTQAHLVYAPRPDARRETGIGTLFPRYRVGAHPLVSHGLLYCYGRSMAVQEAGTALVPYWPRPRWGADGPMPDIAREPTDHLRLGILRTRAQGEVDELWLGERRLDDWAGLSVDPVPVFIREGAVFIAIHPLAIDDLGREHAIALERSAAFDAIDLVNYHGPARTFDDIDLLQCRNGYVIAVAQDTDFDRDFAAFRAYHARGLIVDETAWDDGVRRVAWRHPDEPELAMVFSPVSEGIQYRSIGERLAPEPRLAIEGFDPTRLPWLDRA